MTLGALWGGNAQPPYKSMRWKKLIEGGVAFGGRVGNLRFCRGYSKFIQWFASARPIKRLPQAESVEN